MAATAGFPAIDREASCHSAISFARTSDYTWTIHYILEISLRLRRRERSAKEALYL
jgi:hypothetical protein